MTLFQPILVIPAYNEAESICAVVRSVIRYAPVLVVDDGSTDLTGEEATSSGATVYLHSENRGYEAALASGLTEARRLGFTHAITLDGDGQHNSQAIPEFIRALEHGIDLVMGRRDHYQRLSEKIFGIVSNQLWGVSDPLCGMKAYRLALLDRFGPFDSKHLVGTEFALRIVMNKLPFSEVGVETKPRRGYSRYGNALVAEYKIFRALIITLIQISGLKFR